MSHLCPLGSTELQPFFKGLLVQRQQLRLQAQQVPKKVKRLSMSLLVCFMLIYVVVILEQIVTSMGILFQ